MTEFSTDDLQLNEFTKQDYNLSQWPGQHSLYSDMPQTAWSRDQIPGMVRFSVPSGPASRPTQPSVQQVLGFPMGNADEACC